MTDPRRPVPPDDATRAPDGDGRADQAFDSYFRRRLAAAAFEVIDPATITGAGQPGGAPASSRRPSRRTWVAAVAAAALLVVAAIGVGQLWSRGQGVIGVPGPTPTAAESSPAAGNWAVAGDWALTAASPLGSRYDALAFFADGRYYILGGYAGLTHEVLHNDWDAHGDPVLDGASYDPVANTWTVLPSVAGVFSWVTGSSAAAVVDDRLYVVTPAAPPLHVSSGEAAGSGERTAAVLDLRPGGGWTPLPAPPPTPARADQVMMATDDALFLFADAGSSGATDYAYTFSTGSWTELPRPPQQSLAARSVVPLDATHLLLRTEAEWGEDGEEIPGGHAILDLATRRWRTVEVGDVGVRPAVARGVTVGEGPGPLEGSPPAIITCRFAGVGGASADRCDATDLTRDESESTGGLAAHLEALGGAVVVRGLASGAAAEVFFKLFDPAAGVLWRVPPLPGVSYRPGSTDGGLVMTVMAAGGGSVLSCFGVEERPDAPLVTRAECYLLPVPDPLPGEPLR